MALFRATVKNTRVNNGVHLENGMSVESVSNMAAPLSTNGGKEVIAAFERVYDVDIYKAGAMNSAFIEVVKI